jgi:hypothetical protein
MVSGILAPPPQKKKISDGKMTKKCRQIVPDVAFPGKNHSNSKTSL